MIVGTSTRGPTSRVTARVRCHVQSATQRLAVGASAASTRKMPNPWPNTCSRAVQIVVSLARARRRPFCSTAACLRACRCPVPVPLAGSRPGPNTRHPVFLTAFGAAPLQATLDPLPVSDPAPASDPPPRGAPSTQNSSYGQTQRPSRGAPQETDLSCCTLQRCAARDRHTFR